MTRHVLALAFCPAAVVASADPAEHYAAHCGACHDTPPDDKTPAGWQFATKWSFETVNGIDGHGGAIDNPGVLAVDDLVFVTSGYGMFGQMPGNVLLVFELDTADSAA